MLTDKIKKGDHTIFICKVINVKYDNKLKPLSYFNSQYINVILSINFLFLILFLWDIYFFYEYNFMKNLLINFKL